MTAGVQIYNTSGILQVDDTYAAMSCIIKGTATFVQQPDPAHSGSLGRIREQRATITVAAVNPVIAINSPYLCMLYDRSTDGAGNWTFLLDGEAAASGQSFTYYIFDTQPQMLSNSGVFAWNESGQLTFSSDTPPMQVVNAILAGDSGDLFQQSGGGVTPNPSDYIYDPAKTYAAIPGSVANYTYLGNNSLGQQSGGTYRCVKSVSGGIHMENALVWAYTFTNSNYTPYSYHSQIYDILIVDVTGY